MLPEGKTPGKVPMLIRFDQNHLFPFPVFLRLCDRSNSVPGILMFSIEDKTEKSRMLPQTLRSCHFCSHRETLLD